MHPEPRPDTATGRPSPAVPALAVSTRRTLVRAGAHAAWTVPAVSVAATAPSYAAGSEAAVLRIVEATYFWAAVEIPGRHDGPFDGWYPTFTVQTGDREADETWAWVVFPASYGGLSGRGPIPVAEVADVGDGWTMFLGGQDFTGLALAGFNPGNSGGDPGVNDCFVPANTANTVGGPPHLWCLAFASYGPDPMMVSAQSSTYGETVFSRPFVEVPPPPGFERAPSRPAG